MAKNLSFCFMPCSEELNLNLTEAAWVSLLYMFILIFWIFIEICMNTSNEINKLYTRCYVNEIKCSIKS